jgi:hypothetical protein
MNITLMSEKWLMPGYTVGHALWKIWLIQQIARMDEITMDPIINRHASQHYMQFVL